MWHLKTRKKLYLLRTQRWIWKKGHPKQFNLQNQKEHKELSSWNELTNSQTDAAKQTENRVDM